MLLDRLSSLRPWLEFATSLYVTADVALGCYIRSYTTSAPGTVQPCQPRRNKEVVD